jgi:hypothetical protein
MKEREMTKKGYSLGAMLAACLAAGTAQAQNEQYAKAQLAIADVDGFDNGVALVGTYGLTMPEVHPNFSVEGELSVSVSDPETSVAGNTLSVSYYTLAGYGVYTHPVTPDFSLYGRGGILYEDVEAEYYHPLVGKVSDSDSDIGFSFGLGANVAATKTLDFTAGLTVIESDITHFSAGAHFRF